MSAHYSRRVKVRARGLLNLAVKAGEIERPALCSDCGRRDPFFENLSAHHPDYSKPLAVEWLCRPCHGKRHRGAAPGGREPGRVFLIDAAIRRAVRHRAIDLECSVSHLVNVAVARLLGLPEPAKR